jgi:hypothetical protein
LGLVHKGCGFTVNFILTLTRHSNTIPIKYYFTVDKLPVIVEHVMRASYLTVAILLVLGMVGPYQSDCQDLGRLRYVASPDEIARFFQGKLPAGNVWARDNARYLHLMGEKPLVETAGPRARQVYRLLVDTRPYGIPVVMRLLIAPDGTGEVIGKIGHSPRFPDVLTVNRIATVSQAEIDEFLKLLADSGFWSMPVFETIDPHHVMMGEPGWMFEGEKEGSYHVVCRGTSSLAYVKKAVMFLVDVSKLDLASTTIRPDDGKESRDEIQ